MLIFETALPDVLLIQKDGLSQDADHSNESGRASATTRAPAHYDRNTSWRQAHLADPR